MLFSLALCRPKENFRVDVTGSNAKWIETQIYNCRSGGVKSLPFFSAARAIRLDFPRTGPDRDKRPDPNCDNRDEMGNESRTVGQGRGA